MRVDRFEIFSDQANAAVIRHPERRFPGVLVQGDALSILCSMARAASEGVEPDTEAALELKQLCDVLDGLLAHYTKVLKDHGLDVPFVERRGG
jgi:hypothetical protein